MRPIIRQPLQFGVPGTPAAAASDRSSDVVPHAANQNPYAAPQTIESPSVSPRRWYFATAHLIGFAAWGLFLVSLALPGAAPINGVWGNGASKGYPGYLCAGVCWPFWPSNFLMAVLPLWLLMAIVLDYPRCWVAAFFIAALAWFVKPKATKTRSTIFASTEIVRKI